MHDIAVNELWTLLVALLTIQLGIRIIAWLPVLGRYSIPPAVVGGAIVSAGLAASGAAGWHFRFGNRTARHAAAVFFTTLWPFGAAAPAAQRRRGGPR